MTHICPQTQSCAAHWGAPQRKVLLPACKQGFSSAQLHRTGPAVPSSCLLRSLPRTTLCIRQILQMTFWTYIFSLSAFWIYFSSLPPCFILSVLNCRECQNILPQLEICSQVISSNTTDVYPFSALICWELSSAISDINTALFCIALYPRNPLKSLCSSN